jgi:hypothetical protein
MNKIPVGAAVILVGIVTLVLGLWKLSTDQNNQVIELVNKIQGIQAVKSEVKVGLPYGYKGAPQTYNARTEAVNIKTDFANPASGDNLTSNLEVRVYKFVSIVTSAGDLSKGGVFDEAALRKAFEKQEGSSELDLYPVFSKEFKGTIFGPSETKTINVEFTPTESGYYAVIFAESSYFESNTGAKAVGFIRVTNNGTPVAGATTKGGLPAKETSTSGKGLPATGGLNDLLTILAGGLGALGLKVRGLVLRKKS